MHHLDTPVINPKQEENAPSIKSPFRTEVSDRVGHPRSHVLRNILTAIAVVAVIGLGWAYATGQIWQDHRATLPPETPEELAKLPGILVTAEAITVRPLKRTIDAVGTLYGFEEIVVSSKVEGRILRIHHDISDRIAADELLAEIDPTDYQLSVEQAETNLQVELARLGVTEPGGGKFEITQLPTVILAKEKQELSKLRMERIQSLAERQATTQEGVDNVVSEFRMAGAEYQNQLLIAKSGLATIKARQSALAIAQQRRVETNIRAPIPHRTVPGGDVGTPYVMTHRGIAEGTFVRVGDEICRLVIDGTLKLRLAIPERFSSQITTGQPVEVYTAGSETPFKGTVTIVNPSVDRGNRTFQVEVQVANDRPGLKPGGFAKAVIQVGNDAAARTVPLAAMVRYAGVIKLFTIEDGTAREVQFTPGMQTSDWVEVVEPRLAENAIVVTSGQFSLADRTKVSIRENKTVPALKDDAAKNSGSGQVSPASGH